MTHVSYALRHTLIVLLAGLALATSALMAIPARAQAATTEHGNLVVVVRFNGDSSEPFNGQYFYNSYYTYWQQFKSWFGTTDIPYFDNGTTSLESYMSIISNGTWHVTSFFPQSSGTYEDTNPNNPNEDKAVSGSSLTYITLPHDKSYYESAGDLQLVKDAAAEFNNDDEWTTGSSSWGSNGVLDNLELVVQVSQEPDTTDTLLWPHKSSADGAVSFGGMKVYEYNLVNSEAVHDLGTVKHEYLHTAGLGDLYRVGDTSTAAGPVGIWDVMGSAAGQWPLAQSLVDLKFEDADAIEPISGAGTHEITLHEHYSDKGAQAVKIASPYSPDEYFVFEYRHKDGDVLAPDHLIPSSGLIMYRVNEAVERDVNGHRSNRNVESGSYEDAIYVFRPGETGIHDSAGSLMKAALNDGSSTYAYLGDAANGCSSFGSADLSAGITDGAIVDSTNRNTGIVARVTSQTDDSISIELTIPDYSAIDLWNRVGTTANATQAMTESTAVDSNGIIYQSFVDADEDTGEQAIRVRAWDGSNWTSLGVVNAGSLDHAQLQCVGTTLYCGYSDFSGSTHAYRVAKWNEGVSWSTVASVDTGSSYSNAPDSTVIDGKLFVLVDKDNADLRAYELSGSSLSPVGGALDVGYVTKARIGSAGGALAVACGDVGKSFSTKSGEQVYLLSGSTWEKTYEEGANRVSNIAMAQLDTALVTFVSYDDGITPEIRVIGSDGTPSTSHAFADAGTDIQDASIVISGKDAYLTTVDGNGLVVTWRSASSDLVSWEQLGEPVASNAQRSSQSVSSLTTGDDIYVGSISSSSTAVTLLSHELANSPAEANVPVYRLYNPSSEEHLYTTDGHEVRVLSGSRGWSYEGAAFFAPSSGSAVVRLFGPYWNRHHYTEDAHEISSLVRQGWVKDKDGQAMFYSGGALQMYRLFSPSTNEHLYTTSAHEAEVLTSRCGWVRETTTLRCAAAGDPNYPMP